MNQSLVKSKANAVVTSLAKVSRPKEKRQVDREALGGREKESLNPPELLAGLISTASKSKKRVRTLAETKLEMEVISQCGYGGLDDYKLWRMNMARMKLEGQLDLVEYIRNTVPDSVHMGDPAGGYMEMLKARNSARGHLMTWSEKKAMREHLQELVEGSNLKRKEYGTVMSSEANESGLKQQVRLAGCLMGIKKSDYEAGYDSRSKEQELVLMEALRVLISRDDSAIAWAKRKDAFIL